MKMKIRAFALMMMLQSQFEAVTTSIELGQGSTQLGVLTEALENPAEEAHPTWTQGPEFWVRSQDSFVFLDTLRSRIARFSLDGTFLSSQLVPETLEGKTVEAAMLAQNGEDSWIWDAASNRLIRIHKDVLTPYDLPAGLVCDQLIAHQDGLIFTDFFTGAVFDVKIGEDQAHLSERVPGGELRPFCSSDGTCAALGSKEGGLEVYSASQGALKPRFTIGDLPPNSFPKILYVDAKHIVIGFYQDTVGQTLQTSVQSFSLQGEKLASLGEETPVPGWNLPPASGGDNGVLSLLSLDQKENRLQLRIADFALGSKSSE